MCLTRLWLDVDGSKGRQMIVKMPDGNWLNLRTVIGLRVEIRKEQTPWVEVLTTQERNNHNVLFDTPEEAEGWIEKFVDQCNAATSS